MSIQQFEECLRCSGEFRPYRELMSTTYASLDPGSDPTSPQQNGSDGWWPWLGDDGNP